MANWRFSTKSPGFIMRDLLIVTVFSLGVLAALRRPYIGVLLWVWIGLMNPHRLSWGFAYSLPLAQVSVIVTMLGMLMKSKDIRWTGGSPLYMLILLTIWMGFTTITAIHSDLSFERYIFFLKIMFMSVMASMLVRTREDIVGLVWVIVTSIGYYGIKGGVFTVLSGGSYRVWGPSDSVIEGNNELAVALIMIIPLLYFLSRNLDIGMPRFLATESRKYKIRLVLFLAMLLCGISAIGSQSRGALLATSAMLGMLWWRSDKKLPITLIFLLLIPIVLFMLPESWYARMDTIRTFEEDASAMGRINAWTMAFNIALDRLMGAGFVTATQDIYMRYAPNPYIVIVAHSIYFQVMGEHGFIGLALYLTTWIMTYSMAGRVISLASKASGLEWAVALASMIKVSIVGFAVGGAFLSLAYWDMPIYLIIIVAALHANVKDAIAQSALRALKIGGSQ